MLMMWGRSAWYTHFRLSIYFTLHFRSKLDYYSLQDLGEVELLAVVHSTGYPTAIGAVSVINHYFGR